MRLPSFLAPFRRTIAKLLPSRSAKASPVHTMRPVTDFFDFAPSNAAVQRAQAIGLAERRHIRAKFALRTADLKLHQATRQYGPKSPQAARAAAAYAKADVTLGAAAGSLYASHVLFGDDLA